MNIKTLFNCRFSFTTCAMGVFFALLTVSAAGQSNIMSAAPVLFSAAHAVKMQATDEVVAQPGAATIIGGNKVKLTWSVRENGKDLVYEIQRSTDNVNFSTVGMLMPLENTAGSRTYEYKDNFSAVKHSAAIYYRLKTVENREKVYLAPLQTLQLKKAGNYTVPDYLAK
jgi:hypothetical protein